MPRFPVAQPRKASDPESVANEGYRLLDRLRDDVGGMLLLTATPMQLHDFELYSMVELVEPGLFNGYADFAASRSEIAAINRSVTALREKTAQPSEIDAALDLLRDRGAPLDILEAASGDAASRAVAATWLSRCHRLSHALVRNRKAEVGGFTKRRAHRVDVRPGELEAELDGEVQAYIRHRFASAGGKRTAVGLVLVAFQKMLCSSTKALAGALETRANNLLKQANDESALSDDADFKDAIRHLLETPSDDARAEADTLLRLARKARRIDDAKLEALVSLVDSILGRDPTEKILIFSQFLGSIEMIRARLAESHSVRVFHGQMSRDEKDQAHRAFQGGTQVLIASEAGGEGRNFQFAHIVVNYDLPWNPMKIEQRIGRVDRVGQKRDVEIFNFAVKGMLDERILDVLEHRIGIFTETVGALDPILESFEDELGRIALGDADDVDAAFEQLDADLDAQIREARQLEEVRRDFVLDWRSLQRDAASRALSRKPRATPEDVERFCRMTIGRFSHYGGGSVEPDPSGGLLIRVPGKLKEARKEIEEDYRGSFDVTEALRDERMEFFAMGHPLVESILDTVGDPWWPPVTVLESGEQKTDDHALLVDYRLELYGVRESGYLISHLVTPDGVLPPPSVIEPDSPSRVVMLPPWPTSTAQDFAERSRDAARQAGLERFEQFKAEHAALVEQELERLNRLFSSRRAFLDERVARNEREIESLERFGTASQKRIIPARRGQIAADQRRLADLENERSSRIAEVQTVIPSYRLELLNIAMIVPKGRLEELAS